MKRQVISWLLAGLLCTGPGVAYAGNGENEKLEGDISLSGAFALYPMVVKWAEEFKKLHPDVRIDISGGGAGKGMTDALAKVVDLGMVSRDIHDVEVQNGAFAIAVIKDAVVPTINASNPLMAEIKEKGLSREAARKLWSGEASTWGEVLGTGSEVPVHVYTRSDACGAAETWSAWFGMRQEDLQGTAVYSDPGVASAVQKDRVAIGYNNIAYAFDQKTRQPYEGMDVMPLDVDGNGKVDEDENFYSSSMRLMTAIIKGQYPSPPARNLFLVCNGVPERPVVREFIKFILTEGQQYALGAGYIPLPRPVAQAELEKLNK